jgi:hypothetical protein
MKEELLTDALLREFLLGKVGDAERERLEGLFLTDSEARERVLVVEQELIEDYLEDNLTTEDRENFLLRYGQTSEQQQQLRISKAIKDWALRENARIQPVSVGLSGWSRLLATMRLRPFFVIPIAVTMVIAIVCLAVWLNSRMTRTAIAEELAQLNTPASLRETPEKISGLQLSPGAVRGMEQELVLKRADLTGLVELTLLWVQKEHYPTYRAEIRRLTGDEPFTILNLQPDQDGIRLRLPARILSRGQYQVLLTGIDANGVAGTTEEYLFTLES